MARAIGDLTGQRFGKLTVVSRAEDIISSSGKTKAIAWLCKCDCGNEIIMRDSRLKSVSHKVKSCGCSDEANPNYTEKYMSLEDIKYWEKLYDYVNNNVMGYDENCLSNSMIFRLKGMRVGKFMQSKNIKDKAYYPFKVILATFMFCMPKIKRGLETNTFYTEEIKFNYICKIVENNLNTVYLKIMNTEKAKENASEVISKTIDYADTYVNRYKSEKTNHNKNHEFDDMW